MHSIANKSSLSGPQQRLVNLLQTLNFGRIEALQVHDSEPFFDPPPRVIQKLKMGGDNVRRPEAALQDFFLKRPVIEMLQAIADVGNGVVLSIDVKHGLPFALEIERFADGVSELINE